MLSHGLHVLVLGRIRQLTGILRRVPAGIDYYSMSQKTFYE